MQGKEDTALIISDSGATTKITQEKKNEMMQ
jgi:hypothetical protein